MAKTTVLKELSVVESVQNKDKVLLQGLSEMEATARFKKFGPNELPSAKRQGFFWVLLRVLQEPMLLLLIACGFLYLLTGEARDGVLLFASAVFVISITLYQEIKSERALEALRDLSSPRALVIRDGFTKRIPGREVVPGDLMRVVEGDRIPADSVLISSVFLSVDESLLTGESFSVTKSEAPSFLLDATQQLIPPESHLFSGALVVSGQGLAVVHATGRMTELGKIGRSLESRVIEPTPLQREINHMIRVFSILGITFSMVIALVYALTRNDWPKGILAGLAAAMSLLPEEFPVVMTVFLALGAWRISKKNVLTRRVAAIEALGSISALCVDKTGTLTQNRMVVREVWVPGNTPNLLARPSVEQRESTAHLLDVAALASHPVPFDPMEKAILDSSVKFSQTSGTVRNERNLVAQYPLSSGLPAMSCIWRTSGQRDLYVASKGAPEAILDLCHLSKQKSIEIIEQVQEVASKGMRVLAVAEAKYPDSNLPEYQHDFDFSFIGLLALEDPIRDEVPAAIQECQEAGIRVIMLTGDYPETARSIARRLGLSDKVVSGTQISRVDDLRLQQIVREVSVFARVTPEHKLRIVTALKNNGERVAMTGDGVNDAPSLKWADIGVAMGGRGTDVARESAGIVLLDDSFTSLVAAIRLGRRIYDNLQKAIFFILAIHVPIAGLTILPVIFKLPLLLLPAHIVFMELIIDPACSLVYEMEPEEVDLMKRKPRSADSSIVRFIDLINTLIQGGIILVLVLGLYISMIQSGHPEGEGRATAFLSLILSNLSLILVNRSKSGKVWVALQSKNKAFTLVVFGALLMLAAVLSFPAGRSLFAFSSLEPSSIIKAVGVGFLSLLFCNTTQRFAARQKN